MENYIDIHTHILPGVDDGAQSPEMSLEMLRMAAGDGIGQIILTPHSKPWHRHRSCAEVASGVARLRELLQEERLDIQLYTGNELFYRSGLLEELEAGQAAALADSHYVLVEFDPAADYDYIRNGVYTLLTGGYYPILAHVERYKNVCTKKTGVAELIEMGCFMLGQGLVHFIATDAHDLRRRCPCLSACAKYLEKKFGADDSRRLLHDNPGCVLRDEYIR